MRLTAMFAGMGNEGSSFKFQGYSKCVGRFARFVLPRLNQAMGGTGAAGPEKTGRASR
jgi:hypothetical protein